MKKSIGKNFIVLEYESLCYVWRVLQILKPLARIFCHVQTLKFWGVTLSLSLHFAIFLAPDPVHWRCQLRFKRVCTDDLCTVRNKTFLRITIIAMKSLPLKIETGSMNTKQIQCGNLKIAFLNEVHIRKSIYIKTSQSI